MKAILFLSMFMAMFVLGGCGRYEEAFIEPLAGVEAMRWPWLTVHAPMNANRWPNATISLQYAINEIEFQFNAPPQSVTVVRWNTSRITGLIADEAARYIELVDATVDGFTITDDGDVYIYEIHAVWAQGFSTFGLRVVPMTHDMKGGNNDTNAFYSIAFVLPKY